MLSQVGRVLDEVDWLIAKKKGQLTSDRKTTGEALKYIYIFYLYYFISVLYNLKHYY